LLLENGIDSIALDMKDRLLNEIVQLGKRKSWGELRNFNENQRERIREKCFRWAVPAEDTVGLANILNAAWDVERDKTFWDRHLSLSLDPLAMNDRNKTAENEKRRRDALYELVLKNIEVLEYEHIISQPLSHA
jgi:hypothetical protein